MSIFTVFLKNRNFISKIRISKVTDYAALNLIILKGLKMCYIMPLQIYKQGITVDGTVSRPGSPNSRSQLVWVYTSTVVVDKSGLIMR